MQRQISTRILGVWAFCQLIVSCPGQYLGPMPPAMTSEPIVPNAYGFGSGYGIPTPPQPGVCAGNGNWIGMPNPPPSGVCAGNGNWIGMPNPSPPVVYGGYGNGIGVQGPFPSGPCVGCDIGQGPNLGYAPGLLDNNYRAGVPTPGYGSAIGMIGSSPVDAGAFGLIGSSPRNLINGYGSRPDLSYGEGWGIPNTEILGAGVAGPSGGLPSYPTGPLPYASAQPSAIAGFAPSYPHQHKHTNNNANTNVNVNHMHGF